MTSQTRRRWRWMAGLFSLCTISAAAQTPITAGAFWPALDAHLQFAGDFRGLAFAESKYGEDYPYQQWDAGLAFGFQWERVAKRHYLNIDSDKEHVLVVGGGYEYLQTIQSGPSTIENRLILQATPRARPSSVLLLADRNRVEFRWVNGVYSTRYRNRLDIEYEISTTRFRWTPYAAAEAFYDITKGAWAQAQYTLGIEWPYKRVLMLETYYLRQSCSSCHPEKLNVAGLTLNVFVDFVKR